MSLPLTASMPVKKKQEIKQEKKVVTEQEWFQLFKILDAEYQNKVVQFLQYIGRVLPEYHEEKQESIREAANQIIAYTKNQIKKIKQFIKLEKVMSEVEDNFSIEKILENSTQSQGSHRINTSMALKEIMIDDATLLKVIKQIDNSMKYSSAEHVTDAVEENERFLKVMDGLQELIHSSRTPADTCKKLQEKIENQPKPVVAQSLHEKTISFSERLENFWDSIVESFKVHY